jgi:hypothetical protein
MQILLHTYVDWVTLIQKIWCCFYLDQAENPQGNMNLFILVKIAILMKQYIIGQQLTSHNNSVFVILSMLQKGFQLKHIFLMQAYFMGK